MNIINVIEDLCGIIEAIISGMPKLRIDESAEKRQAKINSIQEVIVCNSKFKFKNEENNFEVLKIDISQVR